MYSGAHSVTVNNLSLYITWLYYINSYANLLTY